MAWHVKDYTSGSSWGYSEGSQESTDNCLMIWSILGGLGWTENAVSALCGNIQHESLMNPWLWQSGIKLASTDYTGIHTQNGHAYGLCQWDPAAKYIDNGSSFTGYGPHYSDIVGNTNDGTAQMLYLNADGASNWVIRGGHNMSFTQFKASNDTVAYLAEVWLYNYEYPGNIQQQIPLRVSSAQHYYNIIHGTPPTPSGNLPKWLIGYASQKWRRSL